MMFVSLYSSIFVVLFTTNNPLLILSITPSIFTDNINEHFETEIPITHDNSTNSNLVVVLSDRNPEAYQDCTNILINNFSLIPYMTSIDFLPQFVLNFRLSADAENLF